MTRGSPVGIDASAVIGSYGCDNDAIAHAARWLLSRVRDKLRHHPHEPTQFDPSPLWPTLAGPASVPPAVCGPGPAPPARGLWPAGGAARLHGARPGQPQRLALPR